MFRTSLLRAARLPRAASTASSASVVASLRLTTARTAGLAQTVAFQSRVVPALSNVARFGRSYSTQTATAESEQASEAEGQDGLITKFADLGRVGVHENLIRSLTQNLRYENMTKVQSMTISPALSGKDIVAQAKTGTGKTLAFLVPVIQRIINAQPELASYGRYRPKADDIRAIIMSPTRELAEQIGEEARKLVKGTGIVVQTAVGGTQRNSMLQRTQREGCHLLVATPGRLNDIISSPDSGIAAPRLEALVLDEADRMLDVGFDRELQEILRYLPDRSKVPRQTLLFSATVPKNVVSLARTYVDAKNFQFVQTISVEDVLTHEKVPQHVIPVNGYENIYPTMLELFDREIKAAEDPNNEQLPFKAIVFLPTTNMVELTQKAFWNLRTRANVPPQFHIHSKLSQSQRTRSADFFRKARTAVLFSSDVTARGMDFPNVTHVIQIGTPPDREQYIHRLGRTGRAGKNGQGWLIVAKNEMRYAGSMLTDLPIKNVDGFACANYDMTKEAPEGHPLISSVTEVMKTIPRDYLVQAYTSFLGGSSAGRSMQVTCNNINQWATKGWGWEQPPPISRSTAVKRGLMRIEGMNISDNLLHLHQRDSRDSRNNDGEDDFARQFSSRFGSGGSDRRRGGNDGGSGGRSGGYSSGGRSGGYGSGDRSGGSSRGGDTYHSNMRGSKRAHNAWD